MKKSLYFCILLLVFLLCACGQASVGQSSSNSSSTAPTWQEQYDLGLRYLSEGNYEEAIIAFTAAIEIDPKQASAYVGRGDAYIGLGETEENLTTAKADYEKAIELDETLAEAYLGLADVYIRQGDYDKTLEILQQGLEVTGSDALRKRLGELEDPHGETLENYEFQVNIDDTSMDVDGQYLSVQIRNSRSATITISGLGLKDSYLTNRSDSPLNGAEYMWDVQMDGEQTSYGVSTAYWAFDPGAEEQRKLEAMQHSVWIQESDGHFHRIADAVMTHTADSMTWTFTVPEEYPFDFAKVEHYTVTIQDSSSGLNLTRNYDR